MKNNIYEYRGFVFGNTPVLLKIEHDKYNPELISAELKLLGSQKDHGGTFMACLNGDKYGNLIVKGENDIGHCVILKNIRGWSQQGDNANLNIAGYEYTFSEKQIDEAESICVNVELTPSGILRKFGSRELHYDGSITYKNGYPEEIEWNFKFGKGKAFARYTYENDIVYDNKSIVQIERPSLTFEIDANTKARLSDIKTAILDEARDFSIILSLCYRMSVNWYEIRFIIIPKDRGHGIEPPLIRRKVYQGTYNDHGDSLIDHKDLINGGLHNLVNSFRSSPIIESLRRSITFLASSQSNQIIENKFFQSIISLESFCDGFIENDRNNMKIPSKIWKMIEKTLRDSLKSLSERSEMLFYAKRVKKKFPELKGITTQDKVIECCKQLQVRTIDLWEKDGFESGLGKALDMRNHLFPRAYCEDPYFLYANSVRIQVLTERLILKHLEWPDDKIWVWYDQEMRRARIDV